MGGGGHITLERKLEFLFCFLFFSLSLWKDAKCNDIITGLPEPPLIICKNDFNRQTLLLHSGTEKLSGIWLENSPVIETIQTLHYSALTQPPEEENTHPIRTSAAIKTEQLML